MLLSPSLDSWGGGGGGGGEGGIISVTNSSKQPQNKNKILTWSYKPNIIYAKKLGEKIDHTRESFPLM